MTFWESQNYGDNKKNQWLPGVGGREGLLGRAQKIFKAEKLFCMKL